MGATPTIPTLRAAIASAIKSALNPGSPGTVNTVHEYRRFWRDEDKFRSLFQRADSILTGKINGWMLYRAGTREVEAPEWFRFYQLHRFELHGYMGVQDTVAGSKETDFHDQIEVIRDNLRLNTAVFVTTEQTRPEVHVDQVERYDLGQVTTWHAILSLEPEAIENKFA